MAPQAAQIQAANDVDSLETQEWLDALEAVLDREGPDRAHYLLERLTDLARRSGAHIPFSPNTAYLNTIPAGLEPPHPGNLELESRIRHYIRWNAMAMVVRANKHNPPDGGDLGGHIASFASLATMIDYINNNWERHIITVEDPVEYYHNHKKSVINQRELGIDVPTFSEALKRALRQDPDVILVGEMRDLETIRLALTAAETGHLVFGTLHTSSAAKTVDRIVDVFPAQEKEIVRSMLSESLRGVISQALLKRIGGGRIAAHEIMIGIPAIRNLIREGKIAQMYSSIQTGQTHGMQTLDQCLQGMVERGLVSKEEARFKAQNKESI